MNACSPTEVIAQLIYGYVNIYYIKALTCSAVHFLCSTKLTISVLPNKQVGSGAIPTGGVGLAQGPTYAELPHRRGKPKQVHASAFSCVLHSASLKATISLRDYDWESSNPTWYHLEAKAVGQCFCDVVRLSCALCCGDEREISSWTNFKNGKREQTKELGSNFSSCSKTSQILLQDIVI